MKFTYFLLTTLTTQVQAQTILRDRVTDRKGHESDMFNFYTYVFGGGAGTAYPLPKQAVEKFATFKLTSELSPTWGQKQIEPLAAKCPK